MGILVVLEGPNKGLAYRLGERILTIGRGVANLIQVIDPEVSRRHASIVWDGHNYIISDLDSRNGTYVNNEKITKKVLRIGDKIKVGNTLFQLKEDMKGIDDAVLKARSADPRTSKETMIADLEDTTNSQIRDMDALANKRDADIIKNTTKFYTKAVNVRSSQLLLREISDYILKVIDADRVIVFKIKDGKTLKMINASIHPDLPADAKKIMPYKDLIFQAISKAKPVVNNHVNQTIYSALAYPVSYKHMNIGLIYIDSLIYNPGIFIPEDINLINMLVDTLAAIISNIKLK